MAKCNYAFRRDKVYRWLKKHGPACSVQIAEAFGLTTPAACQTMVRLKRHGHARRLDHRRNGKWEAIGAVPPEDMRGAPEESLANLRKGWPMWREALMMANKARGKDVIVTDSRNTKWRTVVQVGREDAPRGIVQIPSLGEMLMAR